MKFYANQTAMIISTNDMKYREGKPDYRKYDACYYEIASQNLTEIGLTKTNKKEPRLFVKFNKKTEMNVYLYGGSDRYSAVDSVIKNNQ